MLFWVTLQTNRSESWRLFPLHSQSNYVLGEALTIKQQHYIAILKITLTFNHLPCIVTFKLTHIIPSYRQQSYLCSYRYQVSHQTHIRNMTNSCCDSLHQEERKVFCEHQHKKKRGFQTVTAPTEEFSLNKEFV